MPTGYTSEIYEGANVSLRQFALRCARGMGALIDMRDDPLDAPVPLQTEADTSYYDKEICEAEARIAELRAMSRDAITAAAVKHNVDVAARNRNYVEENTARLYRYDLLIAQTIAWQGAPEGLKEFMLDQLHTSRDFDVSSDPLRYASKPLFDAEWFAAELETAASRLRRAQESRASEIERTARRNEWLAKLHAALPAE